MRPDWFSQEMPSNDEDFYIAGGGGAQRRPPHPQALTLVNKYFV